MKSLSFAVFALAFGIVWADVDCNVAIDIGTEESVSCNESDIENNVLTYVASIDYKGASTTNGTWIPANCTDSYTDLFSGTGNCSIRFKLVNETGNYRFYYHNINTGKFGGVEQELKCQSSQALDSVLLTCNS